MATPQQPPWPWQPRQPLHGLTGVFQPGRAEPSGRCWKPRRVPTVGAFRAGLPRPGPRCCRRWLCSRQECKCCSSAPRRNSSGSSGGGGGGIAAPSRCARCGNDHLCPSLAPAASSEPIMSRRVLPPCSPPGEGAHL